MHQVWLTYCRRDRTLGGGLGTRLAKQTGLSGESEGGCWFSYQILKYLLLQAIL